MLKCQYFGSERWKSGAAMASTILIKVE